MTDLTSNFKVIHQTPANNSDRSSLFHRQINHLTNAVNMRGKCRHQNFAASMRHQVFKWARHRSLRGRGPRPFDIGGVREQE